MNRRFASEGDAIEYIFHSMRKLRGIEREPDDRSRDTSPTIRLLSKRNLLHTPREYAVITGSKGKGSTTALMAKIMEKLGHTTGMITSPHMVSWRERIRVNGQAIPSNDLLRILSDLAPHIDEIEAGLQEKQYFSPQGIFLAIALQWFDEMGVNAAVLEVGRGGRFDDIAVVPNKLSLFTPIMLEHIKQLGDTLERIAWHKAGIIKPRSYVYSVPQASSVLDVLQAEADAQDAEFSWIAPMDMGEYVRSTERGIVMRLGRYGELELSLLGRYQIDNATLAVQGAGNMHSRLPGLPHGAPEYAQAVRDALANVTWPGRLQQLESQPNVYIDGATTVVAARSFLQSLSDRLTRPLIAIVATPVDRDYNGVYQVFAQDCDALILTENHISANVVFPDPSLAVETARRYHSDVRFAPTLSEALDSARAKAGANGTVLIGAALPVVGEALQLAGLSFEQI
jgi:dihydrofolate synthase/folylpolyglutamate synthase